MGTELHPALQPVNNFEVCWCPVTSAEYPIGQFWDRTVPISASLQPTPMASLMACRPHQDPTDSILDLQPLREAVAACMEELSDEDRYVLDAWHLEQITIRELAARLGLHKSYTYRLVKRAERRLRDTCVQDPLIQSYLGLAGAIAPPQSSTVGVANGVA